MEEELVETIIIPKHMSFKEFNEKYANKTFEKLIELGFEGNTLVLPMPESET